MNVVRQAGSSFKKRLPAEPRQKPLSALSRTRLLPWQLTDDDSLYTRKKPNDKVLSFLVTFFPWDIYIKI
jgi:hypothetical protein